MHYSTRDGWTIVGDLYLPAGKPAGEAILLHQRGGEAADWRSLCLTLQSRGIEALAIDQRGTHRSTTGPGPIGNNAPWFTGPDIAGAIHFLRGKRVTLIGASYGANNALLYAAAHPAQIKGIVLFSPGVNYNGLMALPAAKKCTVPTLIISAQHDPIAADSPTQINNLLPARIHRLHYLPGSLHGTALLGPAVNSMVAKTCLFMMHGR